MEIEQIKQSGLLEQYILNLCSPEEATTVETYAVEHPEVLTEIKRLQNNMQDYAAKHAILPADDLAHRIATKIQIIELQAKVNLLERKITKLKMLVVLATLLAVALAASTWFYYNR